jgi:hypothetical protein
VRALGSRSSAVRSAAEQHGGLDLRVVDSSGLPAGSFGQLSEAEWSTAIEGTLQYEEGLTVNEVRRQAEVRVLP